MHYDQEDALVSVIVPIYKVEPYLRECVDSIIGQTYKNLEIILVDDGSPDNCGAICEEYAKHDSRITVYHKENGGLSDARNYGIDRCHGEYLTFVDSDDVIKSNFVKTLMELLEKNDADASIAGAQSFSDAELPSGCVDSIFKDAEINIRIFSVLEHIESSLYQKSQFIGGPLKLYKRRIFESIRFPKGMISEDLAVSYRVAMQCSRIVETTERMYGYRFNPTSIMHSSYSPQILTVIPLTRELYSEICAGSPKLKAAATSRVFSACRVYYFKIPLSLKAERLQVWAELKKYRRTVLFDPKARKRERIMALFSYLGPSVFHMLFANLYNSYIKGKFRNTQS